MDGFGECRWRIFGGRWLGGLRLLFRRCVRRVFLLAGILLLFEIVFLHEVLDYLPSRTWNVLLFSIHVLLLEYLHLSLLRSVLLVMYYLYSWVLMHSWRYT